MAPRSAASSLPLAMSRHRAVRNLNLDEELNEDYGHEYDAIDYLSPEDQEAMDVALATVQSTLGEPDECGVTERRMREVLWDTYFDASSAVTQLLEEKQRNEAQARKRAGTYPCQNVMAQCVGLTARRHHGPRDMHTSEGTVASGRYGTCTHVGAAPAERTEARCDRRCAEQGPPKAASLSRAQKGAGHTGYSAAAHLPRPKA